MRECGSDPGHVVGAVVGLEEEVFLERVVDALGVGFGRESGDNGFEEVLLLAQKIVDYAPVGVVPRSVHSYGCADAGV